MKVERYSSPFFWAIRLAGGINQKAGEPYIEYIRDKQLALTMASENFEDRDLYCEGQAESKGLKSICRLNRNDIIPRSVRSSYMYQV